MIILRIECIDTPERMCVGVKTMTLAEGEEGAPVVVERNMATLALGAHTEIGLDQDSQIVLKLSDKRLPGLPARNRILLGAKMLTDLLARLFEGTGHEDAVDAIRTRIIQLAQLCAQKAEGP